ncbi:MAG TPA: GNAT family N-acetyltransferase [Tepidisphaeraceae bacterium]|nr:GNAT family N-acetyltransferase [Tepidisphaeraceae bacterium]
MPFQLVEHTNPAQFSDLVLRRLLEAEAENCLLIGLASRMRDKGYVPIPGDELQRPLLLTVRQEQRDDMVAIQTLRQRMDVSRGSPAAMRLLGRELARRQWSGTTIAGPRPCVQTLADAFAALAGRPARMTLCLGMYQLTKVVHPAPAPGAMRQCGPEDRLTLARLLGAFAAEINEPSAQDDLTWADQRIAQRRIYFWEDGQPVAIAGFAGLTPNGVRINSVFTPREHRGRGYASNLVAHLSARLLEEGRKFCFLNADAANPTSNRIYQRIGYRPVSESERWEFSPASIG